MNWIADLSDIIPPPALEERVGVADASEWETAEARLGVGFPEDFKAYIGTWGQSYVGDFFFFFSPAAKTAASRIPESVIGAAQAYATLKDHHPGRFTLPRFPEAGSMLMAGRSDNGDYIGWIIDPATDPASWPVAVWGDEDGVPQVFDGMSFGPFVTAVIKGELRPAAFPDDLWDQLPLSYEP